jgi:dTDP-4-amino-4,6-dideoxygalactose transaminase
LAVTEDLSDRIICLPLYDDIKIEEVDAICAVISAAVAP